MIYKNPHGGIEDHSREALKNAEKYDLITFPKNISSINCFNCQWVSDKISNRGFCSNKHINQHISNKMCCNLWNNDGTLRSWEK